jgi:ATP synthase protein I
MQGHEWATPSGKPGRGFFVVARSVRIGAKLPVKAPGSRVLTRNQAERRAALRVVGLQGLIALGVAAAVAAIWGLSAGRSALLGGAVGAVATMFFVLALFRYPEGAPAGRVVWGFFFGQALKVVLTVGLLVLAFRSRGVTPLAFLAGYVATYVAYWLAPRGPASRR